MRCFRLATSLLGSLTACLVSVAPACSSNDVAGPGDAGDAGIAPNRPVNEPCDPSLKNACLPAPCHTVRCDVYKRVCVATPVPGACGDAFDGGLFLDASVADSAVRSGCKSSHDCLRVPPGDGSVGITYVCAFSAYDGCSTAPGVCVLPEPTLIPDGAVQTACGCNGEPVEYVTGTQTSAPAASPSPCLPPVVDAGPDATKDAESEAGMEDAGPDAAQDATLDASSDG